ncbi:adenylate/guanylate cyclase domain-containing protein [Sulfitobacter alexandrii]|uniref:Adenylate/guanylate cyclase domain-containing protein n=1 Tax=Sulfitobacter alexandrii TaxID=1917485 RepID=A0A1J0WEF0_9RHOB|nr:adenylate/guanylate cyclase domain-containing protein [Sulfitobacter alexandrii]APE42695.1 adenylate/guanylate cyclase domain-containing protein [Sulfitobacter alexandrii]
MNDLWRGTIATRLRIASGLVLFVYALLHFLNIGLGLVSTEAMHVAQDLRQVVTRSIPGTIVIYGAFAVHVTMSLARLALRGTLRMPPWEAAQTAFGLMIPVLLIAHLVHTRAAHELFGVRDEMGYISLLLYDTLDGWKQAALLLLVWAHGCIGLHFWLRQKAWWRRRLPWLAGCAALVPGFALAGFLTEARQISARFALSGERDTIYVDYNFPDADTFAMLIGWTRALAWGLFGLLLVVAGIYVGKAVLARRQSVRVSYIDGPEVWAPKGLTLLEVSRLRGVPHAALCGGRGRCTTCRVLVKDGADRLPPPSPTEMQSLMAVRAPVGTRLACQIVPVAPTTVFRVFQPDGRRQNRNHASQGEEKRLALLFLDMRGFTARTMGQLPYDVVFLLNRFFDAVVPAVTREGGTIDKYLGDGFLAIFESATPQASARAALRAIEGMARALDAFNARIAEEGQSPIGIGIGAHLGEVVLGEIGAVGQAPRTLIGDTVNTASRLEGVTKDHRVQAMISAPLLLAAGIDPDPSHLVELQLRGLDAPLAAWPVATASELSLQIDTLTRAKTA